MSSINKDNEQLTSSQDLVEDKPFDLQQNGNLDTNNRGDRISEIKPQEKSDEIISADLTERENALENDLVLECLFNFFNISDLKLLRLICWNWNLVVDPILKNRATVVFNRYKNLVESFIFFKNLYDDIPTSHAFVSFQFNGRTFKFGKLFFEKYGKNIKKLRLIAPRNYINGFEEHRNCTFFQNDYETFNFATFINPSTLTKLHLQNDERSKLEFSLPNLCSIEDLLITRYFITIEQLDLKRISPKHLYLESVVFCEGSTAFEHFCVNQIFDLGKIKEMTLISYSRWRGPMMGSKKWKTMLTLDLSSDNIIAEKVTLQSIILKNLKESTWIVNDLKIPKPKSDFMEKNRMKIKRFTCWTFDKVLDLQCLPETIEVLHIGCYETGGIICPQPTNLSNVRCLLYEFTDSWMITCLPNLLASCVNLVDLWLNGDGSCDIGQIPPSVSKFKLTAEISRNGRDMRIVGNGKFHLQKLILENYPTDEVKQILSKLHSAELVLYMCDPLDTAAPAILDFILETCNNVFKKIVIGQGKLQENIRTGEISVEFVDRSAKYYLLEDRYGTSVPLTSKQFEDFTAF